MQRSWKGTIVRVALLGLACAFADGLWAQTEAAPSTRTFEYSAKFVCRNVFDPSPTDLAFDFGPAFFRTVVNLHNTSAQDIDVRIGVVEATKLGSGQQGEVGGQNVDLRANQAIFVSCSEIRRLLDLPSPQRILDGYVTIQSRVRLDVDAVYTGVSREWDARTDGVTIDVETIQPTIRFDTIAEDAPTR